MRISKLYSFSVFSAILIGVFLCSCNSSDLPGKSILSVFQETSDSVFSSNNEKSNSAAVAYMIIPNTGCTGCISTAESFLKEYISKKYPVNFILTNIQSLKMLRLKLGDSIVLNKRVYTDTKNIIYRKMDSLKPFYPAIFYLNKKGVAERFEYMSPENPDALAHLQKALADNK